MEKTGNILKHASTSQHVQMSGVTKFKMIVSFPNSPLFQVSNLKIQVFQRIRSGAYSTTLFYAEFFPPNVWGKESDSIILIFSLIKYKNLNYFPPSTALKLSII